MRKFSIRVFNKGGDYVDYDYDTTVEVAAAVATALATDTVKYVVCKEIPDQEPTLAPKSDWLEKAGKGKE